MARGRAPSQHAYRGRAGQTRKATVHVTTSRGELAVVTVIEAVDAVTDPDLARRLLEGSTWNTVGLPDGTSVHLAVPTVYHDPAAEVFALVLPDDQRHRELAERIRLLELMNTDDTAVPPYVREFTVVIGATGLRAYLERQAEDALVQGRLADQHKDLERRRAELDRKEADLARAAAELERGKAEVANVRADVERRWAEVDQRETGVNGREAEVSRREAEARRRGRGSADEPDDVTNPFELAQSPGDGATVVAPAPTSPRGRSVGPIHDADGEPTGRSAPPEGEPPTGSDPLTTTTIEGPAAGPSESDPWLAAFSAGTASWSIATADGKVRLAVRVDPATAGGLGRGPVDVRLLLHRTEHYPIVDLVIGPPIAIRDGRVGACAAALLDVGAEPDRSALTQLGKSFALVVDMVAGGRRHRQITLTAPLTENVGFVLRAADDHLRTLLADGGAEPSIARGRAAVSAAGFDVFGQSHPDAGEFRDDKLAGLTTANQVRRALSIAKRFTKPAREDYLVCVRGFPLPRWREIRRGVLERAVEWGLWMGPELAQVAVSEGFARSRRDLVAKLVPSFETLRASAAFDLDGDAADDNHDRLMDEARVLGVNLTDRARMVDSNVAALASGTIDRTTAAGEPSRGRSITELIAALEQRAARLDAAIELCERGDPRALPQLIAAAKKMSRSEAVRVLGMSVRFGTAAAPYLMEGLASSKAYLRHGCALALAMLRTEAGTEAVIELLMTEPTEVWREIARAVGQVGPPALMPLASQFGRLGERATASAKERVAWAMAHVAVRGGKSAVEALGGGSSVVAPVARAALELHGSAANDEVRVRARSGGTGPGREMTVNRAFSRRFFEALEKGLPEVARAELSALGASEPMELVDADLLEEVEADDEAAELDESDIIAS